METSLVYDSYHDKQSDDVVQQFRQYQLLESYIDILRQDDFTSSFMIELVQGILEHNNKPFLTSFKQLSVASSATKKVWEDALQVMVGDDTFLSSHIH
jgi:hypothetical protein